MDFSLNEEQEMLDFINLIDEKKFRIQGCKNCKRPVWNRVSGAYYDSGVSDGTQGKVRPRPPTFYSASRLHCPRSSRTLPMPTVAWRTGNGL